jgi:hypothetical protein
MKELNDLSNDFGLKTVKDLDKNKDKKNDLI